jgi:hypothetical protein
MLPNPARIIIDRIRIARAIIISRVGTIIGSAVIRPPIIRPAIGPPIRIGAPIGMSVISSARISAARISSAMTMVIAPGVHILRASMAQALSGRLNRRRREREPVHRRGAGKAHAAGESQQDKRDDGCRIAR